MTERARTQRRAANRRRWGVAQACLYSLLFPRLALGQDSCGNVDFSNGPPMVIPVTNIQRRGFTRYGPVIRIEETEAKEFTMQINAADFKMNMYDGTQETTDSICSTVPTDLCASFRGGLYSRTDAGEPTAGVDTATLEVDQASISPYPVFITSGSEISGNDMGMNELGLGRGSTVLATLRSEGHIASSSWSLWYGHNSETNVGNSTDGLLVLGGQNSAGVVGDIHTFPLALPSDNCPTGLVVRLKAAVDMPDGRQLPLVPSDAVASFCIVPNQRRILVPGDMLETLADEIGAVVGSEPVVDELLGQRGLSFNNSVGFGGSLKLSFSSGLEVYVPNEHLTARYLFINDEIEIESNDTTRELFIDSRDTAGVNAMPVLGVPFLRMVRLTVNYDNSSFTLANINPSTDKFLSIINSRSIGQQENTCSDPLTMEAKIGIGVGSGSGAAILGAIGFLLIRRRRQRRNSSADDAVAPASKGVEFSTLEWAPKGDPLSSNGSSEAELSARRSAGELQGSGRVELDSSVGPSELVTPKQYAQPAELSGNYVVAELPGTDKELNNLQQSTLQGVGPRR